jgi:hypothetical protein
MRNGKGAQFLFASISVILILSFFGTAAVRADDGTPPPPSEEDLTPPPTSDVLDMPEAEQQDVTNESISLPELQEQLPENTSVVVMIDEQIEPLVTQQATNAFIVGDPIWCPAGASPVPGAGGCTSSYASLLDLIEDIENLTISEPAADGTVWIMDGADASSSNIIFDGSPAGFLTWRDFQLTLQGGWDGSAAGNIIGNSNFSVPIYILDWGASVTINNISINNTGSAGLEVDTSGDVVLDVVSSLGNDTSGFYIEAGGSISANNVIARNNDANGGEFISGNEFTLTGTNEFDNNTGTGLYVEAAGNITVENASASGNGLYGAELIGSNSNISMTGTNIFNGNYYSGLYVEAGGGDVSVEGITANNNGAGGTYGGGAEFSVLNKFTMSGVNVFNGNRNTGLYVEAAGDITAENVTAVGNGVSGAYGAGAEFYSLTGEFALAGLNVFNANNADGVIAAVKSFISISGADAIGNSGSGMYLESNVAADVVCGIIAGNSQMAIDTDLPGFLTLYGVNFDGTPDHNIGISDDQLRLVSNSCFAYPGFGGGGAVLEPTEPELGIRYVTLENGEPFGLDCVYYQGTYVVLVNGDGVYVPCPIADSVQLTRASFTDLPKSPSGEYVSGMDVLITENGLPMPALEDNGIVWYMNAGSFAGYEAARWNGEYWENITDEIHPFMTVFFLIPETAKESDLAIMYWDGVEWIELSSGLHLGNGRIVKQVDKDADGSYFTADVNFVGIFVLVQK